MVSFMLNAYDMIGALISVVLKHIYLCMTYTQMIASTKIAFRRNDI